MSKKQKKALRAIIISLVIVVVTGVLKALGVIEPDGLVAIILYMIAYLVVGYSVLKGAVKGIKNLQPFDENFLMAVATVGAIALGDYTEGVAVILFYQIGEFFQSVAVGKSRRNISALMDIRPEYANLLVDCKTEQVDPEEVEVGSIIRVLAGEKIPIDGVIVSGQTSLNTAALTGESMPFDVAEGDEVISGSINEGEVIDVRTTKEFVDSTVSRILELVENSGMNKSASEKFISKFARVYTPVVCILALILALGVPFVSYALGYGFGFKIWVYRAFTFLVISCPCALVISIPLTFFAGIGGAGSKGILVKGANYIEALSKVGVVAFDKTGTLTQGSFEVDVIHNSGIEAKELLSLAAHVESFSNHPIAKSILRAYNNDVDQSMVKDVTEHSGLGISANVMGREVLCGNEKLMAERNVDVLQCELGNDHSSTVIHVCVDGVYAGHIHIRDVIKPSSKETIEFLQGKGIRAIMLTGDKESVAAHVSRELGLKEYRSGLMPEDKARIVGELLKENSGKLVFVGDGINDAPVLALADIGVAMGALGQDAAIEAADIVLMDDDPLRIRTAIALSKKCMRIVYENIYIAIGIKVICLILGALGYAGMWLAIFADVGVMILAVLNAIRALRVKEG